jgi:hypothetical protein
LARGEKSSAGTREVLDRLEESIEKLRVAYEKYFSGVERAAPVKMRAKVEREVRLLESIPVRSTVLRFRMGGLRARFVTYKHYWTRIERELERGISRRDLLRMRRGLGAQPPTAAEPPAEAAEAAPEAGPNGQPKGPPPPPGSKPGRAAKGRPAAPNPEAAGLDPRHMRDVFKQLVKAKKAAGEATDGLTYAALCRKLAREAPKLRQKHKCEKVRFEVETVGGRVKLRARPE